MVGAPFPSIYQESLLVCAGPLVPADIMLAGFRSAAKAYQVTLNNIHAATDEDKIDLDDVSWGEEVFTMSEWAETISLARRPQLKRQKYSPSSQSPPRTPAKESHQSPAQVRRWYVAKGTSRPGAYVHRHVAESYITWMSVGR